MPRSAMRYARNKRKRRVRFFKRGLANRTATVLARRTGSTSAISEAFNGVAGHRGALLGRELRTNLIYADTFQMTNASGAASIQHFAVNGLYDPDTTGTGHQPRGFDQLMALYDHYEVLGCKVTVQCALAEAAAQAQCVGILIYDGTGASTTVIDQVENRRAKTMLITPGQTGTISVSVNPHKFLGRPNGQSSMIGTNSGNPSDLVYARVFGLCPDGASTNTVNALITLEYRVRFIEPKQPTASL